jgi:hypothetical protein
MKTPPIFPMRPHGFAVARHSRILQPSLADFPKFRAKPALLSAFLALASLAAAEPPAPAPDWIFPDDPRHAAALAATQPAAGQLLTRLRAELASALEQGGPASAVTACQLRALPVTASVASDNTPAILAVKRTSLRLRNPANSPDPAEKLALARFESLLASSASEPDSKPSALVQVLPASSPDDRDEIRVYRPIFVETSCLRCHGDPATFPADLVETLAARYPKDAATGYSEGDWRGLLRISLEAP